MARYILHYAGEGSPPDRDLELIRSVPGVRVVDQSGPRMLLVEAGDDGLRRLRDMPSWRVTPETYIPLPDARPRVKSG
jgi:hypothetical protein